MRIYIVIQVTAARKLKLWEEMKENKGAESRTGDEETHVKIPHLNSTEHETGNMGKVQKEGEKDSNEKEKFGKREGISNK